jgi:nucleoside-diphosphate-sugar epimerase
MAPMNFLVTGAAGFIGSHLCNRLLKEGARVWGVDAFTDFYPKWIKDLNLRPLLPQSNFEFISEDILFMNLEKTLERMDIVFHLAAQPGVRASWGENFSIYTRNNIEATQKLLEAAKSVQIKRLIYASSSSVYGLCPKLPMEETSELRPFSPYGVTKLAAENLCFLYYKNYGVPCLSLRFFTVYGPGQRPDMAFHRFLKAIAQDKEIIVYGDGQQTRDFTYIDDIIQAIVSSINHGEMGEAYNVGGGSRKKLTDLISILGKVCQKKIQVTYQEGQKGDVRHTFADISKAKKDLNYSPRTSLENGLGEQWEWIQTFIKNR